MVTFGCVTLRASPNSFSWNFVVSANARGPGLYLGMQVQDEESPLELRQPYGRPEELRGGGRDDSSSLFLTSSEESNATEAWDDAPGPAGNSRMPVQQDALSSVGAQVLQYSSYPTILHGSSSSIAGALAATSGTSLSSTLQHRARPRLWRLFPRCIRATNEEVCIAAEVTLGVAPSECTVTAVKGNRPLPVRLDFLSDRQATGEDTDQPNRQARGPGAAAARRNAARIARHMLRPQRPDSELVLMWLTPGTAPGLVWIELHAHMPVTALPSNDGADPLRVGGSLPHSVSANMLLFAPAAQPPGVGAGSGGSASLSAADEGNSVSLSGLGAAGGSQTFGLAVRPLHHALTTPSLSRTRVLASRAGYLPPRAADAAAASSSGGAAEGNNSSHSSGAVSSGPLSLVIVPDADMETEIGELLAQQHQQTPLPVSSSSEQLLLPEQSDPPSASPAAAAAAVGIGGPASGSGATVLASDAAIRYPAAALTGGATAALAPSGPMVGSMSAVRPGEVRVEGLLPEGEDDSEDAGARERFLWDLGAWLEAAAAHAAEREAAAALTAAAGALQQVEPAALAPPTAASAAPAGADTGASAALGGPPQRQPQWLFPQYRQFQHGSHLQEQQQQQESPVQRLGPSVSEIEAAMDPMDLDSNNNGVLAPRSVPASLPALQSTAAQVADPSPAAPVLPPLSIIPDGTGLLASTTGGVASQPPPPSQPLHRSALELLGFACSRGWAATSTHIVLGLMDMGHSMAAINAAVQAAHGWSALHLAAASGSAELLAMMALWRSYGRYGDSTTVQEEWRAMLAAPGPGGLTPLHLAAVLPQPATAALDLLSSMPAETLSTWFGATAHDGCTPAHYASRAGNAHLNDHALLCLATGAAALGYGSAQDLPDVMSYTEVNTEALGLAAADLESTDLSSRDGSANGSGNGNGNGNGGVSGGAGTALPEVSASVSTLGSSGDGGGGGGGGGSLPHVGAWPLYAGRSGYHHAAAATTSAAAAEALATFSHWGSPSTGSGSGASRMLPLQPFAARTAAPSTAGHTSDTHRTPSPSDGSHPPASPPPLLERAAAATRVLGSAAANATARSTPEQSVSAASESWYPQRRATWFNPSQMVAGLLDRVGSPAVSTRGSDELAIPAWPGLAAPSLQGQTSLGPTSAVPVDPSSDLAPPQQQQLPPRPLQPPSPFTGPALGPMTIEQAREAAVRLAAASMRAVASAPEPGAWLEAASDSIAAAAAGERVSRSGPPGATSRLLAGLAADPAAAELVQLQAEALRHRQLVQLRVQQQLRLMQPAGYMQQGVVVPLQGLQLQPLPLATSQQPPEQQQQQRNPLVSMSQQPPEEPVAVELHYPAQLQRYHEPEQALQHQHLPGHHQQQQGTPLDLGLLPAVPNQQLPGAVLLPTRREAGAGEDVGSRVRTDAGAASAHAVPEVLPGAQAQDAASQPAAAAEAGTQGPAGRAAHGLQGADGGSAALWLLPARMRYDNVLLAVAVAGLAVAHAVFLPQLILPVDPSSSAARPVSALAIWTCMAVLWPLVSASASVRVRTLRAPHHRFSLGVFSQLLGSLLHAALLHYRLASGLPCCLLLPHAPQLPPGGAMNGRMPVLAGAVSADVITALLVGLVVQWVIHGRDSSAQRR
ncbi:hypothetical protein Agub_g2927 [Astrephomene gubernaculifera]|uniref:Uncharacterized protein n=1 Tax=Astrephomene gubernaculifera TaxID=47775 RepID=A0AAD3DHU0_9CHLO|nr:hypothetical protein Agub_g2927 [Astrephomene gubernaculifera]